MSSLWTSDENVYLVDINHPDVWPLYQQRKRVLGLRYGEEMTPRQRRQFDRDMLAKYGKAYPPPARAEWALLSYDIQDAAEERAARAQRAPELVTVYVDEDLFIMEGAG